MKMLNRPKVTASTASNLRPVNISSFALDLPTILGRRCVPPALYIVSNGCQPLKIPYKSGPPDNSQGNFNVICHSSIMINTTVLCLRKIRIKVETFIIVKKSEMNALKQGKRLSRQV